MLVGSGTFRNILPPTTLAVACARGMSCNSFCASTSWPAAARADNAVLVSLGSTDIENGWHERDENGDSNPKIHGFWLVKHCSPHQQESTWLRLTCVWKTGAPKLVSHLRTHWSLPNDWIPVTPAVPGGGGLSPADAGAVCIPLSIAAWSNTILRLTGIGCKGWLVRVYSGLMLAMVRTTGTNALTHGKEVNGWNVKKCFLEVAGHTIGGSTAPVFPSCSHPQPVSAVSASIAPCGPCQSSRSKKREHRSARCAGKSLDRAEKHRSSGGSWNNLGTSRPGKGCCLDENTKFSKNEWYNYYNYTYSYTSTMCVYIDSKITSFSNFSNPILARS